MARCDPLQSFAIVLCAPYSNGLRTPRQGKIESASADPNDAALAVIGLAAGSTLTALNHTSRRVMKTAHSDAGGSEEQAQAAVVARELIVCVHSWA